MQADIYIGFPIRSIHPVLSFTFTDSGKVFIWLVSVSTSSCIFRMETNGETDHLQQDSFHFIKIHSCIGIFFSYACTRITMSTCLSDKNWYFLHGFIALWWMRAYSIIISHDHFKNSHELATSLMTYQIQHCFECIFKLFLKTVLKRY